MDYIEKAIKRNKIELEAQRRREEQEVRWQKHLLDIKEGKEDTQAVIFKLQKEINELKQKLSKYEKVE